MEYQNTIYDTKSNLTTRKMILIIDHYLESKALEDFKLFELLNSVNTSGITNHEILRDQLLAFFELGHNMVPILDAMLGAFMRGELL